MKKFMFEAFMQRHTVEVDNNDFGGIYELSNAMALANEWLRSLDGYKTGGHSGAWREFSEGYIWVPGL